MKHRQSTALMLVFALLLTLLPASALAAVGQSTDSFCSMTSSGKHSWGDWKTTKKATCTRKGSRERTCGRCGYTQTETVKKAASSREHNDSNILVTGGDAMTDEELQAVVKTWLATPFSNDPRHVRRLEKLEVYSYDDIAALRNNDPELTALIDQEAQRQSEGLELIASENFASCAVYVPGMMDYMRHVLPETQLLRGATLAGTATTLGSLLATILGGWLMDGVGVRRALMLVQIFAVCGAVLLTIALGKAIRQSRETA